MPLVATYTGKALPLYGMLVVLDPSVAGDENDLNRALHDPASTILRAGHTRLIIQAAQDSAKLTVHVHLWDTAPDVDPDGTWDGNRTATVDFPTGHLIVDNTSAGPIDLEPGPAHQLDLPGGPGPHMINAWHRGRENAADRVRQLWEQDEAGDDVSADLDELAGLEEYCLQIWRL